MKKILVLLAVFLFSGIAYSAAPGYWRVIVDGANNKAYLYGAGEMHLWSLLTDTTSSFVIEGGSITKVGTVDGVDVSAIPNTYLESTALSDLGMNGYDISNASNVYINSIATITSQGHIHAVEYHGDGSNLTGVSGSGADNLGNHVATATLNMAWHDISNSSNVYIAGYTSFTCLGEMFSRNLYLRDGSLKKIDFVTTTTDPSFYMYDGSGSQTFLFTKNRFDMIGGQYIMGIYSGSDYCFKVSSTTDGQTFFIVNDDGSSLFYNSVTFNGIKNEEGNLESTGTVKIYQTADSQGIYLYGHGDKKASSGHFHIDADGNLNIVADTANLNLEASNGQINLQEEVYSFGNFINFQDNTECDYGNSNDYCIGYDNTEDKLRLGRGGNCQTDANIAFEIDSSTDCKVINNLTVGENVKIESQQELRLYDSDNSNYVSLKSSATVGTNETWVWPPDDGSSAQVIHTDGNGNLYFADDDVGGAGSGAPAGCYYIVLESTPTLTSERVITCGDALTGTDGGAGSTYTIDFDGGATPAGDLGGTWGTPSVDDDSHDHGDSTVANDITLTNITQITNRAHESLTSTGTYTHATIESHISDLWTSTATLESNKIAKTDNFVGDVTGTYDATVVGDDSHDHGSTTITSIDANIINAGTIDADVIASSIAVNTVGSNQIVADAVDNTKIGACTLDADVIASSVAVNTVGSNQIADSAIVNADINASAAIAISKLATSGSLGAGVICSSVAVDTVGTNQLQDNIDAKMSSATVTTSFEIPNTAGDVTVNSVGEIAVDTTQKQLAVYDGAEKVIPLVHTMQAAFDLASMYDIDTDWRLLELKSDVFPDGIVITNWYLDCNSADPTTELNANLNYCDALADGAFPGGSATLVDVLDTTTGNSSETDMSNSDLGSGIIPTTKILYLDMDADPTDANTVWMLTLHFYIPES